VIFPSVPLLRQDTLHPAHTPSADSGRDGFAMGEINSEAPVESGSERRAKGDLDGAICSRANEIGFEEPGLLQNPRNRAA